jgi:tetratricopeptide (TPR) repeat protein
MTVRAWMLAVAVVAGCRAGDRGDERAGLLAPSSPGAAAVVSETGPALPSSPDPAAELRALDRRIALHHDRPVLAIPLLLDRAWIRGRLDDYIAAVERSAAWVAKAPTLPAAWQARVQVLTRVHELAAARAALETLRSLTRSTGAPTEPTEPTDIDELEAAIDEASGVARAAAYRERMARAYPSPTTLTRWAASLTAAGRHDEALAVMRRVPATVRDNAPALLAWILFQWGQIHEAMGQPTTARAFYQAAHDRLPIVDATIHLAQALRASGGDPGALLAAALVVDEHPELLALAGRLDEARLAWERYLAALPRAFAGRAARFYLDVARDPARALELARLDHGNRDTGDTRLLLAEAALAAGAPAAACEIATALTSGTREQQFMAWRALESCGRDKDAAALAARLGIR